jgi:DNA-binding transcriptional LysR family regulator
MEEIVAYVRAGRGVAYLPVPITAAIAPPGVVFVPVDGIPPGQVVLAWDAERPPRYISELTEMASCGWQTALPPGGSRST